MTSGCYWCQYVTTYLLLLLCSTSVIVRLLLVSVSDDIFTFIALFDFSHRQVVIGVSK